MIFKFYITNKFIFISIIGRRPLRIQFYIKFISFIPYSNPNLNYIYDIFSGLCVLELYCMLLYFILCFCTLLYVFLLYFMYLSFIECFLACVLLPFTVCQNTYLIIYNLKYFLLHRPIYGMFYFLLDLFLDLFESKWLFEYKIR